MHRIIIFLVLCGLAQADPVLFFTDITSGPKTGGQNNLGAFVTIYGEGFGPTRGSSTVTIGGAEVGGYVIWGEDNAVARDMDMIVVQLGPNVLTGNIIVTVNGKTSNALPFTVRSGNIFFVIPDSPDASDSNPGTYAQPFETLYRDFGQMSAGDIVYLKGGTFDSADPRYPGWDCSVCFFLDNDPNGSASAPVAWIGYPGDPPVLGGPQPMRRSIFIDDTMQHYVIANMEFTHYGGTLELRGDWHRIIGNYAHDGIYSNSGTMGITGNSAHYEFFGNRLYNNGETGEKLNGPGIYLQGFGTNEDIDIGWNEVVDQQGSRAIQVYGHEDGDWVDNVRIHDNLLSGSELNNIVLGGSDGSTEVVGTIEIYNNIIIGAGDPGVRVNDPQGVVSIRNNVLYNNGTPGLGGSNAQLYLQRAGVGLITLRNNILFAGASQSYVQIDADDGTDVLDASNDLFYNAGGCPAWDTDCVNGDPLFVNPGGSDFHIQELSPAADAGIDTGITRDYDGVPRPQGGVYDIGAHEYEQPVLGITASPTGMEFGSIDTGTSSAPQTLNVSNTGSTDIHVGTVTITGASASDFAIQNNNVSLATIAPSQIRTLEVVMTPGGAGMRNATLQIPSDDPNTPLLGVSLHGTGVAPALWFDTFDDGDASDWSPTKGSWTVVGEDLTGTHNRKADNIAPFGGCRICSIEADLRVDTAGGRASLLAWYVGKKDLVEIRMMDDRNKWLMIHKSGGITVAKKKALQSISPGIDYHVSATYDGTTLEVRVDGALILSATDPGVQFGGVGFRVKSITGLPVTIASREIYVYP